MTSTNPQPSVREAVAGVIASYVVYDDHGGPDTEVLHDVIGGDYDEATRRVYELADQIIALVLRAEASRDLAQGPEVSSGPEASADGAMRKAIRILADESLHETSRCIDARDVLIAALSHPDPLTVPDQQETEHG